MPADKPTCGCRGCNIAFKEGQEYERSTVGSGFMMGREKAATDLEAFLKKGIEQGLFRFSDAFIETAIASARGKEEENEEEQDHQAR